MSNTVPEMGQCIIDFCLDQVIHSSIARRREVQAVAEVRLPQGLLLDASPEVDHGETKVLSQLLDCAGVLPCHYIRPLWKAGDLTITSQLLQQHISGDNLYSGLGKTLFRAGLGKAEDGIKQATGGSGCPQAEGAQGLHGLQTSALTC